MLLPDVLDLVHDVNDVDDGIDDIPNDMDINLQQLEINNIKVYNLKIDHKVVVTAVFGRIDHKEDFMVSVKDI